MFTVTAAKNTTIHEAHHTQNMRMFSVLSELSVEFSCLRSLPPVILSRATLGTQNLSLVAFDLDCIGVKTCLRRVVSSLHLEQQVHAHAEGFLQAQRHFR